MPEPLTPSDYRRLFLDDRPLLDVRAPVEFAQGAFPTAVNQPLLDDDERHAVGLRYKEQGHDAAVALGHALVSGERKAARIEAWAAFVRAHPDGALYCFRGGQRSRISQAWLAAEAGLTLPRIAGGYKALRRYLLDTLERHPDASAWRVVGGRTGTGKTELLQCIEPSLDLEALANHRGSAFGRQLTPQPPQIDFEHRLAIRLLKYHHTPGLPLLVEDESRNIGSRTVPGPLFETLSQAPLILVEEAMPQRVERILRDYVLAIESGYHARGETDPQGAVGEFLLGNLDRIQRRLGGVAHRELRDLMGEALEAHRAHGDLDGHRAWIERLLSRYYDPMYDHQLEKKRHRILLRGDHTRLLEAFAAAGHPVHRPAFAPTGAQAVDESPNPRPTNPPNPRPRPNLTP